MYGYGRGRGYGRSYGKRFGSNCRYLTFPEDGNGFYPVSYTDEDNDKYLITLEVPGVKKPEVNISSANTLLTVSGTKTLNNVEKKFSSSFALPSDIECNEITSSYQNGTLVIELPKKVPKTRKIKVEGI